MSQLFYDAAPNATRVSPEREADRHYPEKPEAVTLFGTCVVDLFFPEAGLDAIRSQQRAHNQLAERLREQDSEGASLLQRVDRLVQERTSALNTLKRVEALAERTFELTEFLLKVCRVQLADRGAPSKIALHTSCSARREMNTHLHARELLQQLEGVERIDHDHESECCGFGGTFSVRMPEVSGAMVKDKTRSLIDSGAVEMVTADGGCLMNINGSLEKQKKSFRGRHLASFLWERTNGANAGEVA